MTPPINSDASNKLKEMLKNISNGLNPGCYLCGKKLSIENQDGEDGSKGYHYSCHTDNCGLEDGFVKVNIWLRIRQKLTNKMVIGVIGFIGGGAIFSGANKVSDKYFFNNNQHKQPSEINQNFEHYAHLYQDTFNLYQDTIEDLRIDLSELNEPEILSFREKYYMALLYSGRKYRIDSLNVINHKQAKKILIDLVDNYNESDEMGKKESIEIAYALSEYRERVSSNEATEIIRKIEKIEKLDLDVMYLQIGKIYYVMGYRHDNKFRLPSLFNYLKSASHRKLDNTGYEELCEQLDELVKQRKLEFWNQHRIDQLKELAKAKNTKKISKYVKELSEQVPSLGV